MNVKRNELVRLVVALSGACKHDNNVLKDGELVDALETHGQQIARLRKQQKKMLDMSMSHRSNKAFKELTPTGDFKCTDGGAKRSSLDTDTKIDPSNCGRSLGAIEHQQESKRETMGEWISSLQNNKKDAIIVPTDAVIYDRPTAPVSVAVAVEVREEEMMGKSPKTYQYKYMRRSVSPQLKTSLSVRAASPSKQLDRAASPTTVDLSASSASTMASYYDDMYDDYAVCPETNQRYTRSALDRAPSFESMDWTSLDDGSSDEPMQFRSIADDVEQRPPVSRVVTHQGATHAAGVRPYGPALYSKHSTDVYYSAEEGEHSTESSSRVTASKQKNNFFVAPSSTEVVMEVLYGIMEHNENFKWLIDPVNQARVAKLVEYYLRDQPTGGDVSIRAYEDEQTITDLRAHVDKLIHENLKIKTDNVRLMGKDPQSAISDKNLEEAISMQEGYRREAEATFQRELETKSKLVSSLQHELEEKESQIASLLMNCAELPASGGAISDMEVNRLRNRVMEKDREICRLNFQLSTKQKLVDEIAKKVAQQLNTSANETFVTFDNRLDMDMFLFKSVAEKQATIDELKAALLSMEREVRGLEARVAKKTRDTLLLKTKFKSMSSRLTEANVNMSRVQRENDSLVASLKEKQGKMHDLIEFLEGKEKQVIHLEEQVNLRQTQLEHVMTEYEKMQHYQSTNGRPPHQKTDVYVQ